MMRGLLLGLCLLWPFSARADHLQDLWQKLAARGKKLQSLEASFVQRKRLALFKSEVTSKGRVTFARPGCLRWEILPPDASVLVVRNNKAELRVPGEKVRVMDLSTDKTMGVLVGQLFVWLGVKPVTDLGRWYHTSLARKGGDSLLTLKPKKDALKKRIRQIELTFARDLTLARIHILQRDGDSTTIRFADTRINAKIKDGLFR